jgi:hypothetical protein
MKTTADPSADHQVSWQSAFWGLVPIALNSMVQPSGKVCDSPAAIGHLLRVSPAMCFLDAVTVLVRTVVYTITTRSLSAANRRILIQRYTADDDNAGSVQNFKENTVTRWVAIALSIPQIVKLFAFQGTPLTQTCAAMFLGSFVLVELLVVIPKALTTKPFEAGEETNGAGADSLPYLTVAASACLVLYAVARALVAILEPYYVTLDTLQCTGLTIFVCGCTAFVPSGLYSHILRRRNPVPDRAVANPANPTPSEAPTAKPRGRILALENFLLLLITAVPVVYFLLTFFLSPERIDQEPLNASASNVVALVMIAIWALLCLLWASATFKAVRFRGRESARRVEIILSWYFWTLHLVAAVLCYRYVYDSKGTVKPAWTEILG